MKISPDLTTRYYNRNFVFWLLDGTFWGAGFAALGLFTITPGMIHEVALRCPAVLPYENRLAMLSGICFFGISQFLGFLVAGLYERLQRRKLPFVALGAVARLAFICIAVATLFMERLGFVPYLVIFYVSLTFYGIFNGLVNPLWLDLISRMVPPTRRGILIGLRDSSATLIGSAILALFPLITAAFGFPGKYTVMYVIALVFMFLSLGALFPMKELPVPREHLPPERPFRDQIRATLSILKHDPEYRRLNIIFAILALATMSNVSLINMKAITTLQLTGMAVSTYTSAAAVLLTICNAISVLSFGYLGDRWGYKKNAYIGYSLMIVSLILAVGAGSRPWFLASVAMTGLAAGGCLTFMVNFPLEFMPPDRRPTYLSLRALCGAPFIVMPFAGGWIADRWGSNAVFALVCIFIATGILALARLIRDPRAHVPAWVRHQDVHGVGAAYS